MRKRSIAVFDVDGTLINGSSERIFIKYLLQENVISIKDLVNAGILGIKSMFNNNVLRGYSPYIYLTKANKFYLCNKKYDDIKTIVEKYVKKHVFSLLFSEAVNLINDFKRNNIEVILLSAGLEIIISEIALALGIGRFYATRLTVNTQNNTFTGTIDGCYYYGKEKVNFLEENFSREEYDYNNSYAYGNSSSDVLYLIRFGNRYIVNPKRYDFRLNFLIKKHKINVLYWRETVLSK
jgi:HAD superfamily hydrolase (TIGR01490 family)